MDKDVLAEKDLGPDENIFTAVHTILVAVAVTVLAAVGAYAQAAKTVTCVGLYSETDAGTVSYRVGQGAWVIIKVGDKIPANGEIRVNVERDWVEVMPTGNPNAVY